MLVSVDAKTSKPDTAFGTGGRVDSPNGSPSSNDAQYVTSAPVVVHNVVISGAGIPTDRNKGDRRGVSAASTRARASGSDVRSVPQPGDANDSWEGDGRIHKEHQRLVADERR